MKILKVLLIGLAVLVVLFFVVGMLLPGTKHLERDIVIEAPPATVFALVNGFTRFEEWSPWSKIDPDTQYTFDGPSHGVDAYYAWDSEDTNVGKGWQKITASTPYERVESHLDFGPQGVATAFFQLTPQDGGTHITWGFDTEFQDTRSKFFGLLLETFLGPQYEEGLANLKQLAESLPQADFAGLTSEPVEVTPQTIAYVSKTTSEDTAEIAAAFGDAYGKIGGFLTQHELVPTGPPISINTDWQSEGGYGFDAAMTIAAAPEGELAEDSPVQIRQTEGGKALRFVHTGSYEGLEATYQKIEAYMAAHGHTIDGHPWDVWVSDPGSTPEEELITEIYFPIPGEAD